MSRVFKQVLNSTLYKRTAVGLNGKPYNTKPVGGASCPAEQHQVQVKPNTSSAWYWKPLRLFQWSTKKARWLKSSTAFLQRLIDTVCNPAQMYKVELKVHPKLCYKGQQPMQKLMTNENNSINIETGVD